jgi:lipopolysaccharide assembly outer membrane protein LptD (OstA)
MKHTLFLLLAFTLVSFAQKPAAGLDESKSFLIFKFHKMYMKNVCLTINENVGEMKVQNQPLLVTVPAQQVRKRWHKHIKDEDKFVADGVIITGMQEQSLKADHLEYDSKSMTGVLSGHITTVNKGVETEIGRYAVVDFSDNRCRIERLR